MTDVPDEASGADQRLAWSIDQASRWSIDRSPSSLIRLHYNVETDATDRVSMRGIHLPDTTTA